MTTTTTYNPTVVSHPGLSLRDKLEELGMSVKQFSIRTGKPEKTIIAVLNGDSAITADMAVRFEDVLQIPADFWMRRQQRYDEYKARVLRMSTIEDAVDWARQFPYSQMVKHGWVSKARKAQEKAEALFEYFSIAKHTSWEEIFLKKSLKVDFRISLNSTTSPFALSAWLRKGELQADDLTIPGYDKLKLGAALRDLRNLMANYQEDFWHQAVEICRQAGIGLLYTPCLAGAPINGAARWYKNNPLIQISCRFKRYDILWFSLFHEIGHIALHGKKDIFLENVKYDDYAKEKEQEANEFAIQHTFDAQQENEVIDKGLFSMREILSRAKDFNTHPSIILGRLRHLGYLSYSHYRDLDIALTKQHFIH